METKRDYRKAVSPGRLAKLQGYTSGTFGIDGTIEYLEARKCIGFHVKSFGIENDVATNIVWEV